MNQGQTAIYYFGNIDTPPPQPTTWTMTIPPVVTTPLPLRVEQWGGTAIFSETNHNGVLHSKMWVVPDVLNGRTIHFEVRAHLDDASAGDWNSSMSADFKLREISPAVEQARSVAFVKNITRKLLPFTRITDLINQQAGSPKT